ncbi:transmembrane and coiled-coil domains protein 1-like [Python bivittatus]|uniref:Transmembrane and coiled-coil domains protein 1-like n=1 Tax=Python bivittatus TaxID=176946 RepID=A0A9F5IUQ3_PYTBI|nr:transmembrane and coiled-coil domains protein 1-like [Python bivittatus]
MEPSSGEQLYDDPDVGNKTQDPENKRQHESEQKLSKITHNALENINVIGQGLKHLFQHQRRRSSVSPHDVQQAQVNMEPETELENQNTCAEIDGVSTHSTALNRVLQQIRVPPKMKRGTSLHSRRGKSDPPKGSPQINRKSVQDINSGRPRSSSTTDAPSNLSVLEMASTICLAGEEVGSADRLMFEEMGKQVSESVKSIQSELVAFEVRMEERRLEWSNFLPKYRISKKDIKVTQGFTDIEFFIR